MNEFAAFGQVILIDLVLAGDNAVVVGALAAGLPPYQRQRVILFGIVLAVAARIAMSLGVLWLLMIPGIRLVGGVLLLWVAYKMARDLLSDAELNADNEFRVRSFGGAVIAVAAADISMSLDNVLGVAGAASGHVPALVFGLLVSISIMGAAANYIATVINRHIWIAWLGLLLILFVAGKLIFEGSTLLSSGGVA